VGTEGDRAFGQTSLKEVDDVGEPGALQRREVDHQLLDRVPGLRLVKAGIAQGQERSVDMIERVLRVELLVEMVLQLGGGAGVLQLVHEVLLSRAGRGPVAAGERERPSDSQRLYMPEGPPSRRMWRASATRPRAIV